jgi:hypothetical protein
MNPSKCRTKLFLQELIFSTSGSMNSRVNITSLHSPILHISVAALLLNGCTLHNSKNLTRTGNGEPLSSPARATANSAGVSPSPKKSGLLHLITHPLEGVPLFPPRKAPPPKALALKRIGTIRALSHDGSYVIIELEPGVLVTTGSELLVTGAVGGPAHLRVSELQPPFFIADIITGNPAPNQIVQQ